MLTSVAVAVSLFAQTFAGTWACHVTVPATAGRPARSFTTQWSIQPAPGDNWTIVKWGSQDSADGGVAYVGYIPSEHDWAYRDFHYDGTYGVTNSAGPDKNGVWTWAGGGYYTGNSVLHGSITWKATSPSRIDRAYYSEIGGTLRQTGADYCTK